MAASHKPAVCHVVAAAGPRGIQFHDPQQTTHAVSHRVTFRAGIACRNQRPAVVRASSHLEDEYEQDPSTSA